jgi:diguanylate cyclase (GGDEF)-like protein
MNIANEGRNPPRAVTRRPRHAVPEITAGGLAAILAAGAVSADMRHPAGLVWLAVILALYAARLWGARRPHAEPDDPVRGYRRLTPGLWLTGLAWGLASAAALWVDGVGLAAVSLLTASFALAVLTLGNYQGAREAVAPFTLGAALPPVAAGMAQMTTDAVSAAVLSAAAAAAVLAASRVLDRFARRGIAVQTERDALYSRVHASDELIERLEVGVKTGQDQHLALKNQLDETESELNLLRGRADALSSALQQVTPYDPETGLLNAEKFHHVLDREWSRVLRQEMPITLVHMSLDNFDGYRQTYGRTAHEAMLRRVAEMIHRAGSRPGDVAGRLSNEHFALLFPEADHKDGVRLAEVLRSHLRRLNIPNADSPLHAIVTASFGVATVIPNSDVTTDVFRERAASALYEAQFQGGDKVVRFRTMSTIRLERWNREHEGELTPDGLVKKLAILGYEPTPKTYKPGIYVSDRRITVDMIDAIVKGRLCVSLEGESTVLSPGDCLFIPKGIVTSMEVVGDDPVVCLEAIRANGD